ncbi:MAG: MBOAT family protein [Lachnospiraceae bacterium]|nr:MBOAT family protein [Lachnospiraceae bacterium]
MLFNSLDFLIFFPIVVLIYFLIPKKIKYLWLLAASYYFYMCWNPKYILLMLLSTVLTWITGLALENFREKGLSKKWQKGCIAACFIINLGILALFKYFDFFLENINLILEKLGMQMVEKPFDLLLPVGISFYTFQALSYIVDVYREEVKVEKNLARYALFVSFFPQLVAGPIERTDNLLRQINHIPTMKLKNHYERITDGLVYMLYGFFLKMVIADRISLMVDTVFDSWYIYGTVELIAGAVGFAIQIYCDFASYSIIAVGAAQVMGFNIMENFAAPYFSCSIKEFWRRWHISLSTWFKDYVYIPLGGNRCSRGRKYRNLMITFLASGLWHGANWTYVVWGGLHGLYQIVGELLFPVKQKFYPYIGISIGSISHKLGQILTTFFLTVIAWVFFRAEDIGAALGYLKNMFTRWNPWAIVDKSLYQIGLSVYEWNILLASLVFMLLVDVIRLVRHERIDRFLNTQGALAKGIVIGGMILVIGMFGQYGGGFDAKQFIYFQF